MNMHIVKHRLGPGRERKSMLLISRRSFLKLCAGTVTSLYFFKETYLAIAASQQIPVLLYHRVGYSKGDLTVTPERFNRDLLRLHDHGYQTISLAQFQSLMAGNNVSIPDKPLLITFDDGYADNYENAYVSLLNHGMTALFFIITGLLATTDRLTPVQIKEMQQNGMSFGSHTMSHRALADLTLADMEVELNSSRTTLENILRIPIDTVSYPRGRYTAATIKMAGQCGYHYGFTTIYGSCYPGSAPFELRRIPVFSYDNDIISVINKRRYG